MTTSFYVFCQFACSSGLVTCALAPVRSPWHLRRAPAHSYLTALLVVELFSNTIARSSAPWHLIKCGLTCATGSQAWLACAQSRWIGEPADTVSETNWEDFLAVPCNMQLKSLVLARMFSASKNFVLSNRMLIPFKNTTIKQQQTTIITSGLNNMTTNCTNNVSLPSPVGLSSGSVFATVFSAIRAFSNKEESSTQLSAASPRKRRSESNGSGNSAGWLCSATPYAYAPAFASWSDAYSTNLGKVQRIEEILSEGIGLLHEMENYEGKEGNLCLLMYWIKIFNFIWDLKVTKGVQKKNTPL